MPLPLCELRMRTRSSKTPSPIHISFFCSCPIISFFKARRAATWPAGDDGLRSSDNIGRVEGRVMMQRLPTQLTWSQELPTLNLIPDQFVLAGSKTKYVRNASIPLSRVWASFVQMLVRFRSGHDLKRRSPANSQRGCNRLRESGLLQIIRGGSVTLRLMSYSLRQVVDRGRVANYL